MINSGVFVPLSPLAGKSEVKFVKQMRKTYKKMMQLGDVLTLCFTFAIGDSEAFW
jgi:hypothetical protein